MRKFFVLFSGILIVVIIGEAIWLFFSSSNKEVRKENSIFKQNNIQNSTSSSHTIDLESNLPDLMISFTNKNQLIVDLDKLGFWDTNSIVNYSTSNAKVTANSIRIMVFPINESSEINDAYLVQKDNKGNFVLSIYSKADASGTQLIKIGLGSNYLNERTINSIDQWLDNAFWNAIYMTSQYNPLDSRSILDDKRNIFIQKQTIGGTKKIFKVTKK